LNNPLRYTDPTGHYVTDSLDGECDLECVWYRWDDYYGNDDGGSGEEKEIIENVGIPHWLDGWLWDIPSAFGFHVGFSGQFDAGPGAGLTPWEGLVLLNWRSGEISIFHSVEGYGYFGSPGLFGGTGYVGWTTVEGLSENQNYVGTSLFGGLMGGVDSFGKLGFSAIGGRAITEDGTFFIDKGSKRPIEYHQLSITVGGNLIPNGIELGGVVGGSNTAPPKWHYKLPYWPMR
jgi:hypothetical protein